MKILIIYCHPSDNSFTKVVRDTFASQCEKNGHIVEISDLYQLQFTSDMSQSEYERESNYDELASIPNDVLIEQSKINNCDVIVFIYPVFWTEAPAKLVGWFDRVWTYGFAYGSKTMKLLEKAIFICIAGRTLESLDSYGHAESMRNVMINDRMHNRAKICELHILDGMSKANIELRNSKFEMHLNCVREIVNEI